MALSAYKTFPIAVITTFASAACSTLPPTAHQYDSFADYAEAVFRHQNKLISHIMMLSDTDVLPDDNRLENAEESMNDACHLLNEYAEHESNGESMGLFFKHRVQASIENCDHNVKKLEALVAEIEKTP